MKNDGPDADRRFGRALLLFGRAAPALELRDRSRPDDQLVGRGIDLDPIEDAPEGGVMRPSRARLHLLGDEPPRLPVEGPILLALDEGAEPGDTPCGPALPWPCWWAPRRSLV